MRAAMTLLLIAVLLACSHAAAQQTSTPTPESVLGVPLAPNVHCLQPGCGAYRVEPYVRTRSKYGIGCMGNVYPGFTPSPELPPQSYLASDVGKPEFPSLSAQELIQLRHIERYVHSKNLRIAWVDTAHGAKEFIVFNATDGPCEVWAAGYEVLNGDCNEFYQPGENPYHTHAAPGCDGTSRPWMTPPPR